MSSNQFEMEDEEVGFLTPDAEDKPKNDSPDIPFCGCLSLRYYQPFFDVDTDDIVKRLMLAGFYCRRDDNFMSLISQKPDAYGPFWIATTLVFTCAVTSHISSWLSSYLSGAKTWAYDFQSVVSVATLVYCFAVGAPFAIWLLLRHFESKLKLISIICLYGYSMLLFIPAALVCLVPSATVAWIAMFCAAAASSLFLLRNLAPEVVSQARKSAAMVLGSIGIIPVVFMLILKLSYFA